MKAIAGRGQPTTREDGRSWPSAGWLFAFTRIRSFGPTRAGECSRSVAITPADGGARSFAVETDHAVDRSGAHVIGAIARLATPVPAAAAARVLPRVAQAGSAGRLGSMHKPVEGVHVRSGWGATRRRIADLAVGWGVSGSLRPTALAARAFGIRRGGGGMLVRVGPGVGSEHGRSRIAGVLTRLTPIQMALCADCAWLGGAGRWSALGRGVRSPPGEIVFSSGPGTGPAPATLGRTRCSRLARAEVTQRCRP